MTLTYRLVTGAIRRILRVLCRIHDADLARVPDRGPLIIVSNHVNFLEVPLLYTHMLPRPMASFAKVETWRSPLLGRLADLWGAIPLNRGEMDRNALRTAVEVIESGAMLFMAPEGTRSGDGRLQPGKPGVTLLALRSGAPLLPLVHYGGAAFWQRVRRLRRTDFHVVVGQAFSLGTNGAPVTRQVRQQMTDEILYQMAALLPPPCRGAYSNLEAATETYLRFPPGTQSNLQRG